MRRFRKKLDPNLHLATILNLSHEGRGIARINGKTTFIRGALIGETVNFVYRNVKKDYDEGDTVSVVKASPIRVEPKCSHYELCGGCSLQHMNAQEQIYSKQSQMLDLLMRYSKTSPETVLPPLLMDTWNYRDKARLSVRFVEKKQLAMVGFRERYNPRYITEVNQCEVLNKRVSNDLLALRQLIDSLDDKHSIAQIEVAAGDDEIGLIFRNVSPLNKHDANEIIQFAKKYNYKIFLQPGGPHTVHIFYPENHSPYLTYSIPEYQLVYSFHPTDFTQINANLNRAMVKLAIDLLDLNKNDVVLDLFCGLGNFSLAIAKYCAKVLGVEGSSAMVERAYMNAQLNHITNVEFYAADLDNLDSIKQLVQKSCTKILIDPPRSGAFEFVKQIDKLHPEIIVYVSCNPITLARDADILVNHKSYILKKAGVLDMFPHTAHVESIALFVKG